LENGIAHKGKVGPKTGPFLGPYRGPYIRAFVGFWFWTYRAHRAYRALLVYRYKGHMGPYGAL